MNNNSASQNLETFKETSLTLKGSIGFDQEGRKILVNTKGKAFATNELILEIWRDLEKLSIKHTVCHGSLDKLVQQLKLPREKVATVKSILSKLASHGLISF